MACHGIAIMSDQAVLDLITTSRRRRNLPDPDMRRLLRERARLTQADLAETLRVSPATVSRWESGARTPRGHALDQYADLLIELTKEGWA